MKHIKNILREPLLHFLLIGAGLFIFFEAMQEQMPEAFKRIIVSPGQLDQLQAKFKRIRMREPTQQEFNGLIEDYVLEEVYYREALALGLDKNDSQVKQRMRLKLEFLLEELTAEQPPSDEVLNEFMQQNEQRFFIEPTLSLQQLYLNPDKRKEFDADAQRILEQLRQGVSADNLADATLLPFELRQASQFQIRRTFGDVFADEVVKLPVGDWSGSIYSQLGVHLVKVSEHIPGYLPELSDVRDQVERDYLVKRRQQLKDKTYAKLREGYEVVFQDAATRKDADARFPGKAVTATQATEVAQK